MFVLINIKKNHSPTFSTQQGQTVYIVNIFCSEQEPYRGLVILLHFITIFMHCGHISKQKSS